VSPPRPLFPPLADPPAGEALRIAGRSLSWSELRGAVSRVAADLAGAGRVAVWALPELETAVGAIGALCAGATLVPVNPKAGERELGHIVADSAPEAVLAGRADDLPGPLAALPWLRVDPALAGTGALPPEPQPDAAGIVLYTSGTTGPPKGAVVPRRAISSNLDALARVWGWTSADVLVHGLPLFHAHGLVLGTLGPARIGCRLVHVGRFTPEGVAAALAEGGTMLFSVPTMISRLAAAALADESIAKALASARLLVSGSAALPVREHERIARATGRHVVERYGLTETLMNCAVHADDPRPGTVGPPLPGVEVRLVDDAGAPLDVWDDETIGEVHVRGPNVFTGYLNAPEATSAAFVDGWFRTGDLATRAGDGVIRIVGRRATDLIKTGGYKVGAGEVEAALLEHPSVAEAAVVGEPDEDLGERIVAWVVVEPEAAVAEAELVDHVARLLTPHKRPREVRFLAELPRNEMGKVRKGELRGALPGG
jgi:malonyl-CoA/methylmalonyl-CoA synthetase